MNSIDGLGSVLVGGAVVRTRSRIGVESPAGRPRVEVSCWDDTLALG